MGEFGGVGAILGPFGAAITFLRHPAPYAFYVAHLIVVALQRRGAHLAASESGLKSGFAVGPVRATTQTSLAPIPARPNDHAEYGPGEFPEAEF